MAGLGGTVQRLEMIHRMAKFFIPFAFVPPAAPSCRVVLSAIASAKVEALATMEVSTKAGLPVVALAKAGPWLKKLVKISAIRV